MIHSNINAVPAWPYTESMQKALAWLKANDLENMAEGKYEIDGDDIYALIQLKDTDKPENRRPEAHYDYVDVQYLISGDEYIGFSVLADKEGASEEHPERDIWFKAEAENESFVHHTPGDFSVFFTNDLHRPNCTFGEVSHNKKVIVKIRESAF